MEYARIIGLGRCQNAAGKAEFRKRLKIKPFAYLIERKLYSLFQCKISSFINDLKPVLYGDINVFLYLIPDLGLLFFFLINRIFLCKIAEEFKQVFVKLAFILVITSEKSAKTVQITQAVITLVRR